MLSIVIVPAIRPSSSNKKGKEACSWLKPLVVAAENDTRVFYELVGNEQTVWEQLLGFGSSLVEAVR